MEKIVIGALGVFFKMIIRLWVGNSNILCQNIVDMVQFIAECGLSFWEAQEFNRTIEGYIDLIAKDFIKEFGDKIENKERKEIIFTQIKKDVENISFKESSLLLNPEELSILIMNQSRKERATWNDAEISTYEKCIRYISKAGTSFASKLPSFTPEAVKLLIDRQKEYYQEIISILREIHSMTEAVNNVKASYQEYERIYRENLISKYGKVELIGSGIKERNIRRYDISSAYVELNYIEEGYEKEIELSQVFGANNIVWIKGEAGAGKTTFLQWITLCAAKGEYGKIENINNAMPIVIGLRNIEWPINLQDIVNKITEPFGHTCPAEWIPELLKQKRALLLFDGLDEISEKKRQETYDFVETIIGDYPEIKVLLTARNSVSNDIVCKSSCCEIVPMNMNNIKEFISYWHRSVLQRDAIASDEEIEKLQCNLKQKIAENQPLKTLARNPLLCAMICALNYVYDEQLPKDKMELYEKCCEMLMDARDNQRNIGSSIYETIPQLEYSVKRIIMEEIAYWMMSGDISSAKRSDVEGFLESFLKRTNILAEKKAGYNIKVILDFFVQRSGIIRETEKGYIDFIHNTFIEFLSVKAICRDCAWHVLVKEACNVYWKETILMCFREMGKENVEDVLKALVHEGEAKKDDRYILIASLAASYAVFRPNDKIKEKIDVKINEMIPPQYDKISELEQAGIYLLPFLKDSKEYTNNEREKCLILLNRIGTEEIIPEVMSYIAGEGDDKVKIYALNVLSQYKDSILEEYNVKEQLLDIALKSIVNSSLVIYECMVNLIKNEKPTGKNITILESVKYLNLICGVTEESLYIGETNFFEYLKKCEKITLIGDIQKIKFLDKFAHITDLSIKSSWGLSKILSDFPCITSLKNVKCLFVEAKRLSYMDESDLCILENVETIEIHCSDKILADGLNIKNFDNLSHLKRVVMEVDGSIVDSLNGRIPMWKNGNNELEISVYANAGKQ